VEPVFGTRATVKSPPEARTTLFRPAATDCPLAVLNVGQEISSVPPREISVATVHHIADRSGGWRLPPDNPSPATTNASK